MTKLGYIDEVKKEYMSEVADPESVVPANLLDFYKERVAYHQNIIQNSYNIGDHVRKVKGHEFRGIVVTKFFTLQGQLRYVVESTVEGAKGLLFIFNHEQLAKDDV